MDDNQNVWPSTLFYIRAKNKKFYFQTLSRIFPFGGESFITKHLGFLEFSPFAPNLEQIWVAIDRGNKSYALIHANTGLALTYAEDNNSINATPTLNDLDSSNPLQGWKLLVDKDDSSLFYIISELDDSYNLSIGTGPTLPTKQGVSLKSGISDPDLISLELIKEEGRIEFSEVEYTEVIIDELQNNSDASDSIDISRSNMFSILRDVSRESGPSNTSDNVISTAPQIIDNSENPKSLLHKVAIEYKKTTSYIFQQESSKTTGYEISVKLGLEGPIGKLLKFDAEGTATTTTSTTETFQSGKTQTDEQTFSYSLEVTVPANSVYKVEIQGQSNAYSSKYNLKNRYNADSGSPLLYSSIPGVNHPMPLSITGYYYAIGTYGVKLVISDITDSDSGKQRIVQTKSIEE